MHPVLVRILKQGIPVALILAALGYLMAEAAGMFFSMQAGGDSSIRVTVGDAPATADGSEDLTRSLQRRLPFTLAGWGFGLVVVVELLLSVLRGRKPAVPSAPKAVPTEDETEKLLNQLLQQADAAEAGRAKAATDTPPPGAPCPVPSASENSPVNN